MTKTAIAFSIFFLASSFSAVSAAQDANDVVGSAFAQLRQEQNETRNTVNAQSAEIKALKQKLAANQAAPGKQASIDYSRYDRASRDCSGVGNWIPDPSKKDQDAVAFNNQSADGFKQFLMECMAKRTAEDFAADARRAQKREQRIAQSVVVAPPAPIAPPGAMQGEDPEAMTADLNDERDGPAGVQPVFYPGRPGYAAGGAPRCGPGFRFDPRERMCLRHVEVDVNGPSPYNVPDNVARCQPGTTREITVRGPFGPRRVQQVCRSHH